MSNCPHCGYSAPGAPQECPACGQFVGPAANPPAPGDNPYAAPTTASAPAPAAYGYAYPRPITLPTSGKAIASMVIGICSIVFYFLGFILGPLAIGLWASARSDFKQLPPLYKGQGLATAGLVTGIIGSLIGLLMVVVIILSIALASQGPHR